MRLLNPTATLVPAKRGNVAPATILNTGLFNTNDLVIYTDGPANFSEDEWQFLRRARCV